MNENFLRNEKIAVMYNSITKNWLRFDNILHEIRADKIEDVLPSLKFIEESVKKKGVFAAGFISYEASPAFDTALSVRKSSSFPLLWFGLYKKPEIINLSDLKQNDFIYSTKWRPSIDKNTYDEALIRIKKFIADGETYQVNLTYRLHSRFNQDSWPYFLSIVRGQPTEYGAYIDTGRYAICSASPELFFQKTGTKLVTRPMKGTAPRGLTLSEDRKQSEWLYNSEKNRAENVMIVDMIRNDLGRIAEKGSVNTTRLFEIEKYPTVWQMTSTVTGQSNASIDKIFEALFPSASVTGAPKPHTSEIIAALETTPRNIYTGSIGFISPDGNAQFNVAIRTVLIDREKTQAEYGVGGGIVWDSSVMEEYRECQVKTMVVGKKIPDFSLLETMLWTPEEKFFLLDYHLLRLRDSAEYFNIRLDLNYVRRKLEELEDNIPDSPHKIRLLVSKEGDISFESFQLEWPDTERPVRLRLAEKPVDSSNPFLYHKTTNREIYDSVRLTSPEIDETLLWNEHDEITETIISNIAVMIDGELVTPPVSCGLLAGTYRSWLIDNKIIIEKKVKIEDLKRCEKIYLFNSVRKKREAILC